MAVSSTRAPRAVFTNNTPRLHRARAAASIIFTVWAVAGTCRLTASARHSSSSRDTNATPSPAHWGRTVRVCTSTVMPKARPMAATRRPISP